MSAPIFIIVMVFVVNGQPKPAIWSDDNTKTIARYPTLAICQAKVKDIEEKIALLSHNQPPPYYIGCKEVEQPQQEDKLDKDHT